MILGFFAILLAQQAVASSTPDGQLRGSMHAHYLGDDGYRSMRNTVQYFKDSGAEFVIMTPHAHVLPEPMAELDSLPNSTEEYRVRLKKSAMNGISYLKDADDACDIIPVIPGFEVGIKPSHFLVIPNWTEGLYRYCDQVIDAGKQVQTVGYPQTILKIDKILQETGGFIIQAHPFNPSYPFNFDFKNCQSAVGGEFMNGRFADYDQTLDRLLEIQKFSSRPVIATSGVDFHLAEGDLGLMEGIIGKDAADTFLNLTFFDGRKSYIPAKRWVYVFGRSANPMVIASQIRDAHCYAAYDKAQILKITAEPGTHLCPPRNDVFFVKTRGIPADCAGMTAGFVDDESGRITKKYVPFTDDFDGTRTCSFSVSELRESMACSGKLVLSCPFLTTSAVIIDADKEALKQLVLDEPVQKSAEPTRQILPVSIQQSVEVSKPVPVEIDPLAYSFKYRSNQEDTNQALVVFNRDLKGWTQIRIGKSPDLINLPIQLEMLGYEGLTKDQLLDKNMGAIQGRVVLSDWSTSFTGDALGHYRAQPLRYYTEPGQPATVYLSGMLNGQINITIKPLKLWTGEGTTNFSPDLAQRHIADVVIDAKVRRF